MRYLDEIVIKSLSLMMNFRATPSEVRVLVELLYVEGAPGYDSFRLRLEQAILLLLEPYYLLLLLLHEVFIADKEFLNVRQGAHICLHDWIISHEADLSLVL